MSQTVDTSKRYAKSAKAFAQAQRLMPGGVSSPVRAYKSVGCDPVFIKEGKGATVTDIDGNEYVDYVGSYGPLILGHAYQPVITAINKAARRGTSFGMPTQLETQLAGAVTQAVPSVDKVRFVNSGTEACMSAIRLARAATGRNQVIKCTGCYHGHTDALLVQAGSGATTHGKPSSEGVPDSVTQNTLLVPFNDLPAVEAMMTAPGAEIACMMVEPIAGNMGCVAPAEGYLQGLRDLCDKHGVLLVFDEVMTGFRVDFGGAQKLYGVKPDITCLGKIVGGGLPCAAYGGREDLMAHVAPDGGMYQAGTLSGNPLAMAAGVATLEALQDGKAYEQLEAVGQKLMTSLLDAARDASVTITGSRVGSMLTLFFHPGPVTNYEDATRSDTQAFSVFFRSMLEQGVVLPPSQYETWFISTAHDERCIAKTIDAAKVAFAAVAAEGGSAGS